MHIYLKTGPPPLKLWGAITFIIFIFTFIFRFMSPFIFTFTLFTVFTFFSVEANLGNKLNKVSADKSVFFDDKGSPKKECFLALLESGGACPNFCDHWNFISFYAQNIVFDFRKKRTIKAARIGGRGELIRAMPESKHYFLRRWSLTVFTGI